MINKNRGNDMKNFLMYILIIVLVFMLLLPPGLRMFGKNLYNEKNNQKKDNDVYVLRCTGLSETINTSYMNDKPYNFQYLVKGNYIDLDNQNNEILNYIVVDIKNYSELSYNDEDDTTEYRIAFNEMENIPETLMTYSMKYDEQNAYYTEHGFNCTKISY